MIKIKFKNSETSYYVEFERISDNVVKAIGNKLPKNESGFYTFTENDEPLGDFTDYTTIYSVDVDGIKFSNDGSTEPTEVHTIEVQWEEDTPENRPNEVNISILRNGKKLTDIISPDKWIKEYNLKPWETLYLVDAEDIDGYKKTLGLDKVIFTLIKVDPVPPLGERVSELEEAICELYELIG